MTKKQGKNSRAGFDTVLDILRNDPEGVFMKHARMLSDLNEEKLTRLNKVLTELAAEKRAAFFRHMDTYADENLIYDFSPIAMTGMNDPDGHVRTSAIHILSREDSREIGSMLLEAALSDPFEEAQIAAIRALGEYMYEADMDEPIPVSKNKLRETLFALIDSEKKAVRREAVVACAISGDPRIREIISAYLAGTDTEELIAGLTSVNLSMSEEWNDSVLELLAHHDEDVRRSAFRAAGTLELREALPVLYDTIAEFDRISPELLLDAVSAVAEIGNEDSIDVLETLGEAAVDLDSDIVEMIDDSIDTLNMAVNMGFSFDEEDDEEKQTLSPEEEEELQEKIEEARERCLAALEEKIPHDLEDDVPIDTDEDEDEECGCGGHHHHHGHEHHHHDNPLEGMDLSRFRILDDLETYEKDAGRDEDEEELWAEFEDMAEEDLDADSLREFIEKLEKKKAGKKGSGRS